MERIPGFMASAYNKAAMMAIGSYYHQVAAEVVAELKSGIVLDVGTGPGYLPIEIVKRTPAIRVVGIDLTPELIAIAQENSVKAGVSDKLHFEVMNAAKLRFEDNAYDMVFSSGMLHSLRSRDRVGKIIRECYRVLKAGGGMWVHDPATIATGINAGMWQASLTPWERFLYQLFTLYERLNPPHYYMWAELAPLVAAAGFDTCSVEERESEIKVKLRKPQYVGRKSEKRADIFIS